MTNLSIRHVDNALVAFSSADVSEANAGVSCRTLNDCTSRLQAAISDIAGVRGLFAIVSLCSF